eukprot:3813622-Pyramimonas_sp.AAC.1
MTRRAARLPMRPAPKNLRLLPTCFHAAVRRAAALGRARASVPLSVPRSTAFVWYCDIDTDVPEYAQ